jgi:hypothetical protein
MSDPITQGVLTWKSDTMHTQTQEPIELTPTANPMYCVADYYVVAVGYTPEDGMEYATDKEPLYFTTYHHNAKVFDDEKTANKWMTENYEKEQGSIFPCVKRLREYVELADC